MDALNYARPLIEFPSVSSTTNVPITDYVQSILEQLQFETERLEYDDGPLRKACVVAKKGIGSGGLAWFGHTDVVPAEDWFDDQHGPFEPVIQQDRLYGRGSCDMKGSLACMLAAAAQVPAERLRQPLYITCTADEEIGFGGARYVAENSQLFREMVNGNSRGIIGEPTRLQVVYAHKGSFGFRVTSHGRAAHSSTRHGRNANLAMIPFLVEMKRLHDETEADGQWQNPAFDPPTVSWNIGINDHTKALNITPARSICTVYFRPMPGTDAQALVDRARQAAQQCGLEFEMLHAAPPLGVDPATAFVQEMLQATDNDTAHTVAYGTDGCMLTELKQLVVFGPGDIAQAHTADEFIELAQLQQGTSAYGRLIEACCM